MGPSHIILFSLGQDHNSANMCNAHLECILMDSLPRLNWHLVRIPNDLPINKQISPLIDSSTTERPAKDVRIIVHFSNQLRGKMIAVGCIRTSVVVT